MHFIKATVDFGLTLARLRRQRGLSQQALALRAGLSQRHLSFLETGRSKPGSVALRKLVAGLALAGWEHRALLDALTERPKSRISAERPAGLPDNFLDSLTQWPAYSFAADGRLVGQNAAMHTLLGWVGDGQDLWQTTSSDTGPNIYDLVFHPDGLLQWMDSPEEVVPETLRRLRATVALNPSLVPVLRRMESYTSVRTYPLTTTAPPPVLVERYTISGVGLSFISVISLLASPGDAELGNLRIESFVPADERTKRFVTALALSLAVH